MAMVYLFVDEKFLMYCSDGGMKREKKGERERKKKLRMRE